MVSAAYYMHEWLTHLESGSEIGTIFFDFKMAYDTVPHLSLLSKLENNWIRSPYHHMDS